MISPQAVAPKQLESDESIIDDFGSPGHHLSSLDDPFSRGHQEFMNQIESYNYDDLYNQTFDQNAEDLRMINDVLNSESDQSPANVNFLESNTLDRDFDTSKNSPFKNPPSHSNFGFAMFINETEVSDDESSAEQNVSPIKKSSLGGNISLAKESKTSEEASISLSKEKETVEEVTISNTKEAENIGEETSDKENKDPTENKAKPKNPLIPKSIPNNSHDKIVSLLKRIKSFTETMRQLSLQCATFLVGGGFVVKHPSQKDIYTYKYLPNSDIITISPAFKVNKAQIDQGQASKMLQIPEGREAQIKKFDERIPSLYRRASIGSAYLESEWKVYFIIQNNEGVTEVHYFEFGNQAKLDNIRVGVAADVKVEKMHVAKYETQESILNPEENCAEATEEAYLDLNFAGSGLFETPDAYDTKLSSPTKNPNALGDVINRGVRGSRGRGSRPKRGSSDVLRSILSRGRGGRGSRGPRARGGRGSRGGGRGSRGGGRGSRGGGRGSRGGARGSRGGARGMRARGAQGNVRVFEETRKVGEADIGVEEMGDHGVGEGQEEALGNLESSSMNGPVVQRTLVIDEF